MEAYELKYDYHVGYNHKLYRGGTKVIGTVHKDGKILEVSILVPCYDPSNKLTTHLDKLPIDVLNKIKEEEILVG